MKSSKGNCSCHALMGNKLEWIKDLMSLHSQSLKYFFTVLKGTSSPRPELILLSTAERIFNEYFNQGCN